MIDLTAISSEIAAMLLQREIERGNIIKIPSMENISQNNHPSTGQDSRLMSMMEDYEDTIHISNNNRCY